MSSKYAMGESKIVFGNTYLEPLYFAESSTWHWEANNKYRRAPAQHGCCASNRTGAFEDRRFLGKYKCEAICSSQREKVVNHLRRERLKAITKNLITTLEIVEIEALEWRISSRVSIYISNSIERRLTLGWRDKKTPDSRHLCKIIQHKIMTILPPGIALKFIRRTLAMTSIELRQMSIKWNECANYSALADAPRCARDYSRHHLVNRKQNVRQTTHVFTSALRRRGPAFHRGWVAVWIGTHRHIVLCNKAVARRVCLEGRKN